MKNFCFFLGMLIALFSASALAFDGCSNDLSLEIGGYQLGAKQSLAARVASITKTIDKEKSELSTLQSEFELNKAPAAAANVRKQRTRINEVTEKLRPLCAVNARTPKQERQIVLYGKQLAIYNAIAAGTEADSMKKTRKMLQDQSLDLDVIQQELSTVNAENADIIIDLACGELNKSEKLRLEKVEPLRNQINRASQGMEDLRPAEVCARVENPSLQWNTPQNEDKSVWQSVKDWF